MASHEDFQKPLCSNLICKLLSLESLLVVLLKISDTQELHAVVIQTHSGSRHRVVRAQAKVSALAICLFNIWWQGN